MSTNIISSGQPAGSTFDVKIDLWKECDVNKLVEHFHSYTRQNSQFERLQFLCLTPEQIGELFHPDKEITSFRILLGLDQKQSPTDQFTFRPIITVEYANHSPLTGEFIHGKESDSAVAIVPHEFKEWLTKNWMELDVSLIDDAFGSFFPMGPKASLLPQMRTLQRLLGYYFTEEHNTQLLEFINSNRGQIRQFWFHLGVDMNKSGHEREFVFSPVFEVHIPAPTAETIVSLHRSGLRTSPLKKGDAAINGDEDETVYFEYLAPCPSTCN